MSLPAHQQALLNGMDRVLEARDPRLASMFAIFTRLTRDDGPPRTERLARGPNPVVTMLRAPVGWAKASAIPIVLVACLMAAIIALGIATSGGSGCRSAVTMHQMGPARNSVCPVSANG